MRHSFASIFRLIACLLMMSVLTSELAMAAYICPEEMPTSVQTMAMEDMPCSDMDMEQPVQCAEYQSGEELALEHFAAAPSLAPVVISSVTPVTLPTVPKLLISFVADPLLSDGADPPYLQTLRLRI